MYIYFYLFIYLFVFSSLELPGFFIFISFYILLILFYFILSRDNCFTADITIFY